MILRPFELRSLPLSALLLVLIAGCNGGEQAGPDADAGSDGDAVQNGDGAPDEGDGMPWDGDPVDDSPGDGDTGDPGVDAPTCNDGVQNGDETGVDCGGSCEPCPTIDPRYPEHPITIDQHFIVPENCEDSDTVGLFSTLYTDPVFHERQGPYSFSIAGGNTGSAFAIDSQTGIIGVNNAAAISFGADFELEVRVTVDEAAATAIAHIGVLDSTTTIYIDSTFEGTSTGSRSAPYRNFKDSDLGNGQPGMAYLFRRGATYVEDHIYLENGESDAKIIIGAWGSGDRPIFDGNSLDLNMLSLGSWYDEGEPESDKCHNVDVYDLDMRDYGQAEVGGRMLLVPRAGHTFNFYRLRASGGQSGNGAIYLMAAHPVDVFYDSEIYMQDIESYDNTGRGVKIEAGGVLVENFKDIGSDNTPISACMTPHVTLKYIYAEGDGNTGPNLRQYDQNVEWAYFTGYYRAIFVTPTLGVAGYGPWPLDDNYIRNVIIDGTTGSSGITMEITPGATNVPENLLIDRVLIKGAVASGIHIAASAVNTTVSYSLFYGNGNGITIDSDTPGARIHNVTVVDNTTIDIENNCADSGELINTIFDNAAGAFATEETNFALSSGAFFTDRAAGDYRPTSDAPYIGAGTSLGYEKDLDGHAVADPPTVGCYEFDE